MRYEIYEDESERLYLFVFNHNQCVYAHRYSIAALEQLKQDIRALRNTNTVSTWADCAAEPRRLYFNISAGAELIATDDIIYSDRIISESIYNFFSDGGREWMNLKF